MPNFSPTPPSAPEIARANRFHWDTDAEDYHRSHPEYLRGFNWCPEMLPEAEARLLGDVSGSHVLELGCGSAPCSRWLAEDGVGFITAFDISAGMLHRAGRDHGVHLVQADALHLPYRENSFEKVFSAFGAIPFIRDLGALCEEVARVLIPGGRFVYSVNHPMRWIFVDDPDSLQVYASYFEEGYTEFDESGTATYAEFQHKVGDHIRALTGAGFLIEDMLEPEWPKELTRNWGQWSPERGRVFPGTAIFSARLPG